MIIREKIAHAAILFFIPQPLAPNIKEKPGTSIYQRGKKR